MTQEQNTLFDAFQVVTELSKQLQEAGVVTFQECNQCYYVTFNELTVNVQDRSFYFHNDSELENNNSSLYWAIMGILLCYGFKNG